MWNKFSDSNYKAFREGAIEYSHSMPAMCAWGLVTGVAMAKSSLTLGQALGMSLLTYAGSAQLAALPLFAAGMPIWSILITVAVVNSRFIIFSAGLLPHFSYLPFWRRSALGYFNIDLLYLLFTKKGYKPGYVPGKEAYYWGMAAMSWTSWQISSIAGIFFAHSLPSNWGLDLAGTIVLIPLVISTVTNRSTFIAVLVAAMMALMLVSLPYRLGLTVAVICALIAGTVGDAWFARFQIHQHNKNRTLNENETDEKK